ncbi:MAG: hypothetical protein WCB11_21135 [Terriglobales bacterium]
MADRFARKVAELTGTGRVGGMPGHRHAASLLRVHNPPFDPFLLRRGRRSLLSYAQIVVVNEKYLDDMHETEESIILHSNLASYLEGDHGIVIEVDRAQNLAKSLSHKNPLRRRKSGQHFGHCSILYELSLAQGRHLLLHGARTFRPAQKIMQHLVTIDFVQHLVTTTGILFFGHVREASRAVSLRQGLEPFEVVIYRVPFAGKNVDGQIQTNTRDLDGIGEGATPHRQSF